MPGPIIFGVTDEFGRTHAERKEAEEAAALALAREQGQPICFREYYIGCRAALVQYSVATPDGRILIADLDGYDPPRAYAADGVSHDLCREAIARGVLVC